MNDILLNPFSFVKIKLTPKGRAIVKRKFDSFYNFNIHKPAFDLQEDAEGYSVWQLVQIMGFGEELFNRKDPVFELDMYLIGDQSKHKSSYEFIKE